MPPHFPRALPPALSHIQPHSRPCLRIFLHGGVLLPGLPGIDVS
jgi:hypothetical protein